MLGICGVCDRQGDSSEKECSVFFYPEHYRQPPSYLCAKHEEGMRQMVNDREQMFKTLMANSVRAPELEVGLDPIYTCQNCENNFGSGTPERYCPTCRKIFEKIEG